MSRPSILPSILFVALLFVLEQAVEWVDWLVIRVDRLAAWWEGRRW